MKGFSMFLRIFGGIIACLLVLLSAVLLLVRTCVLDGESYAEAVLTDEFYAEVDKARGENLMSLGTMVEVEEDKLDEYASEKDCRVLAEKYVRALINDLMNGTKTAGKIHFSSEGLLAYLKADYAGFDFTEAGYASSDKAAEAAYGMICGQIDSAVFFVPERISRNLDSVSRVLTAVSDFTFFWFVPFLVAIGIYVAMFFTGNRINNLFGAASSVWCAAILCFVPILILFIGSNADNLEFDRNALFYFISGCISTVRSSTLLFSSVFLALATAFIVPAGLKATAARTLIVPEPPIVEDFVAPDDKEESNGNT